MDAHQAEAVRSVRAPIVVRAEPDIPIIVRILFVIPADRVSAAFRGFSVEEDPGEMPPGCLNASHRRAGALVWDH